MSKLLLLFFISFNAWSNGNFHLLSRDVTYTGSNHARSVYIYLPDGYGKNPKVRYPVLYMHDGQNLYDPSRAYLGQTWKALETLNHLIKHKIIPPIIVVGIDNTPDRLTEYTHDNEQGENYLRFIVKQLKPRIDQDYLTLSQREHTAIMGSSLGGLISLYAGAKYHQTFGKVGALSPSVWWSNASILKAIEAFPSPLKIYVDSGTEGGETPHDAGAVARIYEARDLKDRLLLYIQEGADHSEKYWAKRLPVALHFLFKNN